MSRGSISTVRKVSNEKDSDAKIKPQAHACPWVQGEDAHKSRQECAEAAPQKGARKADSLSKRGRLRLKADFEAVYRGKNHLRGGMLKITFIPNPEALSRLGIVVRKKEVALSSRRNRIRRLIKEAFRKTKHLLNGNYDIVVFSLAKDASIELKDVELELLNLYKKAGVMAK